MKDYLLELTSKKTGSNQKLNAMREYLQAYILKIIHDRGFFQYNAFVGGTALRFIYDLPRFSEDLDFSQVHKPRDSFKNLMSHIENELNLAGYKISVLQNEEKTVQSSFIKFESLLYETGLTPLKSQKFSIKLEIDTNPPEGAGFATHIINKFFPISFFAYDIPSLFAGKFRALLSRKYTKGRDYFDLGWYLSRFKEYEPNMTLLHNGLRQTGWSKDYPRQDNWRQFLLAVVEKTDWKKVLEDTQTFLENPDDMKVFTKENIIRLINKS